MSSHPIPYLLAVLLGSAVGSPAAPQGGEQRSGPTVVAMNVDIWPEFDDPRVLVIYDGMLAAGTETPVEFSFVVPADAQVHMAGGIAPDGGHLHADFDTRLREDGLMEVSYTLQVPHAYMEFYYDSFTGADERRFTYPVVSRFDIDSLVVRVQEPLRAEGFELDPAAEDIVQDDRGLSYGVLRFAARASGTVTPVTVSYRKSDRQPSVAPGQAPTSGQDRQPGPSSSIPWGRAWSWIFATLAAGFFAVGFYERFAARRRDGERGSGPAARPGSTPVAGFCTECGHPAAPSHRYCGGCGRPLREARRT